MVVMREKKKMKKELDLGAKRGTAESEGGKSGGFVDCLVRTGWRWLGWGNSRQRL